MSQPSPPPDDPAMTGTEPLPPRQSMPRHTTPTWEMELLISGATVFALMQLPSGIDSVVNALLPRFEQAASALILLPSIYLKSAAYALILTFILHLATRGYWVALVGLSSVYPEGVRWDALKMGPNYLAAIRARMPTLAELIERADNRASQVFGFGLGFALVLLAPLVFVTLTALLSFGLAELLGRRDAWYLIWNVMMGMIFLPYFVAMLLDRWIGRRLAPQGRGARFLRRLFTGYLQSGFQSFVNFPVLMFTSLIGQHRAGILLGAAIVVLAMASLAEQMWGNYESRIGQYAPLLVPDTHRSRILDPQHYADQRDPVGSLAPLPFIPSEIVRGDYVRLFIPYRPDRDNPAVQRQCPDLDARLEQAPDAALDCLAAVYQVSLDGVRVADPQFDRAVDSKSGLRGVVAMLRVADLAPGRHEIEIARPLEAPRRPDRPLAPAYRIPFWR
jgi:hypothetical protein